MVLTRAQAAALARQPDPRLLHGTPEDVFIYLCSFLDHRDFVCTASTECDCAFAHVYCDWIRFCTKGHGCPLPSVGAETNFMNFFLSAHPTLHPPQLRLAEVCTKLLHKVRATPRYDALMELKTHWPIDMRKDKPPGHMSPADIVLAPSGRVLPSGSDWLTLHLPFPQVLWSIFDRLAFDLALAYCKPINSLFVSLVHRFGTLRSLDVRIMRFADFPLSSL